MSYLQSTSEEWAAQWIMHNPDRVSELSAYWFHSPIGKVIVWAIIKAKKNGPVTLDTIKQHAQHRTTTNDMLDIIWNRPTIDDSSLTWCLQYFKTRGMLFELYEARLDDKWSPSEKEIEAIQRISEHIKEEIDTPRMHEWIKAKWMKVFETKAKHLSRSKDDLIQKLVQNEQDLLNRLNIL